jgi:DNA-directed RNA polymerase specialized sigma24 family protein
MEPDDRELVERFRKGDQEAARALYERYARRMLRNVQLRLRFVVNRGAYDSEGILQDGFRSFFSAVGKPEFDSTRWVIAGLLGRIIFWKCMLALRRPRPIGVDPENLALIIEGAIECSKRADSAQVVAAQCDELVHLLQGEMTQLERRILSIYLDEEDQRSLDEIGETCGCSVTTVRATMKTFEAALRRQLKQQE